MSSLSLRLFFLLFFCFSWLRDVGEVYAETAPKDPHEHSENSTPQPKKESSDEMLDVVLLLDSSASMRLTDPEKLRVQGAKLFLQFLNDDDRLGIIEFSRDTNTLQPLTQFSKTTTLEFSNSFDKLGDSGLYTDILAGVRAARDMLVSNGRSEAKKLIVLLSDGKMDPDPALRNSSEATQALLHEVLPDLKVKGIVVHTLAFSEEVDKDLLNQIALGADGVSWFTPNAQDLHKSFADLLLVIKKPQVLPMKKGGFALDEQIEEATFYLTRENTTEEIELITPSEETLTYAKHSPDIRWFRGEKFDVITADHPEPGTWLVGGVQNQEGYATVLTNLKLTAEWAQDLHAGDTAVVKARFFDLDRPVVLPQMSGVVTFAVQVTPTDKVSEPIIRDYLLDDGTEGDETQKDGIFSRRIKVEEAGEYRMKIVARGPTFEREQNIPFRVKPKLVALRIVELEPTDWESVNHELHQGGEEEEHQQEDDLSLDEHHDYHTFEVQLAPDTATFRKVLPKLIAEDEAHTKLELPIVRAKKDPLKYYTLVNILPRAGTYRLRASLVGQTRKGSRITGVSDVLEYEFHIAHEKENGEEAIKKLVTNKEPKKEVSVLLPLLIASLINLLGGGFLIQRAKKGQGSSQKDDIQLGSNAELESAIIFLEKRSSESQVNEDDPRYFEEPEPSLEEESSVSAIPEQEPATESEEEESANA